jgi:hypothetical protein
MLMFFRDGWNLALNVSAVAAPRPPSGFGCPMVVSSAVWCSIFEIQFGAAQHDDRRHPHPHRQSGGGAQRTLGCVVISEIRQIPSKGGLVSKVSRERRRQRASSPRFAGSRGAKLALGGLG